MTDTLRERLIAARLADSLSVGHNTAAADVALGHVRAWLAEEDTVERMARVTLSARYGLNAAELTPEDLESVIGQIYVMNARTGLAALAAALASEVSDDHA